MDKMLQSAESFSRSSECQNSFSFARLFSQHPPNLSEYDCILPDRKLSTRMNASIVPEADILSKISRNHKRYNDLENSRIVINAEACYQKVARRGRWKVAKRG